MQAFLKEVSAAGTIPGLSLATLRAGQPEREESYGVRGAHDHASVDTRTVFEAASLTKPVVALLALQLAEERRLDLAVPLVEICGDYVPNDFRARKITSLHVLTHTSGLPNIVREEAPLKTYFEPGERFSYGSSAFAWLQRAMQTVSGQPLETLARERLFGPLGMRDSSLEWQARFSGNHAQGHEWNGEAVPKRRLDTAQASWSLLTTAADYLRFVRMILNRDGLSGAMYERWFSPAVQVRQGENAEDLVGVSPPDPLSRGGSAGVWSPRSSASSIGGTRRGFVPSCSAIARRAMRWCGSPIRRAACGSRIRCFRRRLRVSILRWGGCRSGGCEGTH
jgi:CubicO group peptidase (beta-lactamase class C family)